AAGVAPRDNANRDPFPGVAAHREQRVQQHPTIAPRFPDTRRATVRKLTVTWALFFGLTGAQVQAAVQPHGLFTDGMVLQQGMKVPVWGKADAGESVTVRFQGQEANTITGKDGKWQVNLYQLKAGGPFTLVIEGSNKVELKNVFV